MAKLFNVALVQASYPGSTAAAIDKSHTLGAEATEKGADLALFQELWTTGYEFFDPAVPSGHAQCYRLRWLGGIIREIPGQKQHGSD